MFTGTVYITRYEHESWQKETTKYVRNLLL